MLIGDADLSDYDSPNTLCHQGAVPVPVGFDFTPRSRWDDRKNPGGRQKERVRLLFGKANYSPKKQDLFPAGLVLIVPGLVFLQI